MGLWEGSDRKIAGDEGTFSGTGAGGAVGPMRGMMNVLATGEGTVQLERSFDGGSTFVPCSRDATGTVAAWAIDAASPVNMVIIEPEDGVLYRFACTAFVSEIVWRISQ